MRLDRTRPYAAVAGRPGVAFEQDGRNFRPDGSEVITPGASGGAPISQPPVGATMHPMPQPAPITQEKRGPGRPRKAPADTTILQRMYAGFDAPEAYEAPARLPERDVLAGYRDPQAADGSMVFAPAAWVDGI